MLHDRLFGGRSDGGDLKMLEITARDAKFSDALPHRFDAIRAGQNKPVVALDIFQSAVERLVRLRPADLNERDFNDSRAQAAQAGGKAAGLVPRASDQNPSSGERMFFVGLAHAWLLALSLWLLAISSQVYVPRPCFRCHEQQVLRFAQDDKFQIQLSTA